MKLKLFRISYIIALLTCAFTGIALAILTFILVGNGALANTDDYFLNIVCYAVGILFTAYESYVVFKSFRYGTLLLKQISFKIDNKRRVITGIISSLTTVIGLFLAIFFLLMRLNVLPFAKENYYLTYDFLSYYGLIIFVNSAILLSYYIFLRFDDVSSFK